MVTRAVYTVHCGETATFFVEAVTGDPTTATSPICKLKAITAANAPMPDESVAAVLTLTPVLTAAAPPIGPGWLISISSGQSAALSPGYYVADFACSLGGAVIATDPVILQLVNAVSIP